MRLDTATFVDTPERVRFRQRVAGPGRRAAAWCLDLAVQGAVLTMLALGASATSLLGLDGLGNGALLLGVFVVQWTYGAAFETVWAGRTPGKWALGLRVVASSGAPARPGQYLLRNLLKGADFLPVLYGVGVVVMACDPRLRRIGDLVADTVVVDERPGPRFGSAPIEPPISEDERQALPARIDLTRDEVAAVEELLRRKGRLAPERVEELAELLAGPLADAGVRASSAERAVTLAYARATGRDRALGEGA